MLYIFFLGLIVIILLNYFCIPYFGIKGAGLVSIIGQVLTNLVFPLLFLDKDINLEIKNIMISFVKAPLFIVKDIKAVIKL
ncbi:polysaccharide biosynthesis C-terminal domain-containing protein [Escherichia coli]|uniref:polysaccharide biosynthesis C-terminal domain-containing protein n=1 Tax=Escherichia coli TaxID=562 RepID=UPI0013B393C6